MNSNIFYWGNVVGGLGNQLFIIATTISTSIDNECDFIFHNSTNIGSRKTYWTTFLSTLNSHCIVNIQNPTNVYTELFFHYNKIPQLQLPIVQTQQNIVYKLDGYYQSPKYFNHNKDTILNKMGIIKNRNMIQALYPDKVKDVALHIRLGDYVYLQNHHPIMPLLYYYNALTEILRQRDTINGVNVFCEINSVDDINTNYINPLKRLFPTIEFVHIQFIKEEYNELLFMSLSPNIIMANSTFSWWASYLSNDNSLILYPDIWFGPNLANHNTKDLFLSEWKKIPTGITYT